MMLEVIQALAVITKTFHYFTTDEMVKIGIVDFLLGYKCDVGVKEINGGWLIKIFE